MTQFLAVPVSHLWWIAPSVVLAFAWWRGRASQAPVPVPVRVRRYPR